VEVATAVLPITLPVLQELPIQAAAVAAAVVILHLVALVVLVW
jgi:hypothetical protein